MRRALGLAQARLKRHRALAPDHDAIASFVALLDAELLAEVYLELIGARQAQLGLAESVERRSQGSDGIVARRERPVALSSRRSEAERAAHRQFVASLGETAVWRNYLPDGA